MNISISITLTDDEREILLGLIKKNKYAQAASAILYLAEGWDDRQVALQIRRTHMFVERWRQRFADMRMGAFLRSDATRDEGVEFYESEAPAIEMDAKESKPEPLPFEKITNEHMKLNMPVESVRLNAPRKDEI